MALWVGMLVPQSAARERGPTIINDCQTISTPGSYKLGNNINAAGDCLLITAQGVSLDLDGFALVGNGTGTAVIGPTTEARSVPEARTSVKNGDIANFAQAINLSGTVEALRVTSNGIGIVVSIGVVRDNIVQFNGSAGLRVAEGLVTANLVVANATGIVVEEAAVVTGNEVSGNKVGVDVTGTGSTLSGNVSDGNSEIGLRVRCPSNLTNNTAVGNTQNLVLNGANCLSIGNLAP
jgi:hypothetical protein